MRFRLSLRMIFGLMIIMLFLGVVLAIPSFHTFGTSSRFNEDVSPLFSYNFSSNVTIDGGDPDDDIITYTILGINSSLYPEEDNASFYSWIILNSSTGVAIFNITGDNQTGQYNLSVFVENDASLGESRPFYFTVNATNDAPNFTNIEPQYNMTQLLTFTEFLNASDELSENHFPLLFNISFFDNCTHAIWSTRTNCSLFNAINTSNDSALMNFTPTGNDVGVYYANISVMDAGENYNCSSGHCEPGYSQNQTTYYSTVVFNIFSTLEINVSDCQNRVFNENTSNTCQINITTKGEIDELNVSSYAFLRNYAGSVSDNNWFYTNNITNSSNFIETIYVNVTPSKTEVGNWTINFSAFDLTLEENSTVPIYIYVNRTYNDIPDIQDVLDIETSINYANRINLTVYDDDLFIPDKNETSGGFNETIDFNVIILNQSNLSQELVLNGFNVEIENMPVSGTSRTEAKIEFTPNSTEAGLYTINISVTDNDGASDYTIFNMTILDNSPPEWILPMNTTFVIYEDNLTYLNLSSNVTDVDNDTITFTFSNTSEFNSFNITGSGIINFTSLDLDVGEHIINITISDGYLTNTSIFNFTIYNLNDTPVIEKPIEESDVINATLFSGYNINCSEDNYTTIYLWVQDEDFKIPSVQKEFYNESITLNLTIEGPNPNLFQFTYNYPTFPIPGENRSQFYASFTPNKTDLGSYNITVNITDFNNFSDSIIFNLTVIETDHYPEMMDLINHSKVINQTLYSMINTTDVEDGSTNISGGNTNFTYSYSFINGTDFINNNESIFNTTTGELNKTFNSTDSGYYRINITVNDSTGRKDSGDFWLYVYDYPSVSYPETSVTYSLSENVTSNITFNVNHTVMDNLTYLVYFRNVNGSTLKYNSSFYGNGSNLTWEFTPNFSDSFEGNLSLIVYPSNTNLDNSTDVNTTTNWNLTIANDNYPLSFIANIGGVDSTIVGGSPQILTLSDYFYDADAADPATNQTIGFTYNLTNSSGGTITISYNNWTNSTSPSISFSATVLSVGNYTITAYEYNLTNSSHVLKNITSNVFSIYLNLSSGDDGGGGDEGEDDTGGGGGGGSKRVEVMIPYAFKLIAPDSIEGHPDEEIKVPLSIINTGDITFNDLIFLVDAFEDKLKAENVHVSLDKTSLDSLEPGQTDNLTMTLLFYNNQTGDFTVIANATSADPLYSDWAEIHVNIVERNLSELERLMLFVEEFVVDNPECIEITEIVNEAKRYMEEKDYVNVRLKAEQAIVACKESISQVSLPSTKPNDVYNLVAYMTIFSIVSLFIGIMYYMFKRRRVKLKDVSNSSKSFIQG